MNPLVHPVRLLLILAVGLSLAVAVPLLGGEGGQADSSCAAPKVFVPKDTLLRPGSKAVIKGKWFFADCYDTPVHQGNPPPMRHLRLRLKQQGKVWRLGTADANRRGRVIWKVRIPKRAHRGKARLVSRGDPGGTTVRIHERRRTPQLPPHSLPASPPVARS